MNGTSLAAFALGVPFVATILYVPWIFLMRNVAIRQIRAGAMATATARGLLERLSGGLVLLGAGNVFIALAFLHPDLVAPPLVATLAFPVACIAVAAAAAIRVLAQRLA